MKINAFIILLLSLLSTSHFGQDYFSVGTWRDHLPYTNIKELAVIDELYYGISNYSLVEINTTSSEITKFSTVNGLSEVGISSIVGNQSQKTLVVAFQSSNIDLIKNGQVINFSAILNSNIIGDKTIYELVSKDRYVYACTGFGIVVIDLNKTEVKDTYILGDNNTQIKVKDIHISNDSIFALTDFGIRSASLSNAFLSDANSWSSVSIPAGLVLDHLESKNNDFIAYGEKNIILQYNSGQWDTIIYNPLEDLKNVRFDNEKLMTCTPSYITVYDNNLDTNELIFAFNGYSGISPNDVLKKEGFYWVADANNGIQKLKDNFNSETIVNGGPYTNEAFHLSSNYGKLYVSAGRTYGTNWNKSFNWNGVFELEDNSWSMYNQRTIPLMAQDIDTVTDIIWVTPDPNNESKFYASSFSGGLLFFENGQLKERYSSYNSSLQTRIGQNGNFVYIAGSDFDNNGNLWVANSFSNSPLSVKTSSGEWKSFYCGSISANNLCTDLIVNNQYGYVWMIIKGVGILVYDYNQTPLDDSDDQYKIIGTGIGSGSLPSTFVNTLAIDYDGEIWIGTDKGPVVFYSAYPIFNESTYDAQKVLLEQDGSLQYLLENEIISDIVIDGANRKWIACDGGGLFLMSEDGAQTEMSFSNENSPLFSNNVKSLAIDNSSGELFISTDIGVLGYRSTATSPNAVFTDLEVFPNPVRPDYFGNIAVKGMMDNAEVKITNSNGFLIKTIFANGGQAVWDGKNENNENVSSGVYYIFSTSADGFSKAKTKVLVIR